MKSGRQPNNPVKIKSAVESEARCKVCGEMADRSAVALGVRELFQNSQQWRGYKNAFNSWERAVWKWVDIDIDPKKKSRWRQYLLENRNLFPAEHSVAFPVSDFDLERGFQTYLLRRAVFMARSANRKKKDPSWWKRFSFFLYLAAKLNDEDVFKRVVQLTQDSNAPMGKRALSDWLRMYWVPGCFWAFTNNGISALITRLTGTGNEDAGYSEGSIKNTISALKLWRPVKPLYWGLDKDNQLVPLW